jgi:hypothetical protein
MLLIDLPRGHKRAVHRSRPMLSDELARHGRSYRLERLLSVGAERSHSPQRRSCGLVACRGRSGLDLRSKWLCTSGEVRRKWGQGLALAVTAPHIYAADMCLDYPSHQTRLTKNRSDPESRAPEYHVCFL